MPRYLPRWAGISPMVDQALTGDTQHFFQIDVLGKSYALAGQCCHMAVQLSEQTLALCKKSRRAQVPISLERRLLQHFNIPQSTAYVIQIALENARADTDSARAIAQEGLDYIPVLHHEIRFLRAKRFKHLVGPGCHIHEQRFFTAALVVIGIAEHDHRAGLGVPQIGIEQFEFAHYRRVAQGEQRGLELFAGGALGHDVKPRVYWLRAVAMHGHLRIWCRHEAG